MLLHKINNNEVMNNNIILKCLNSNSLDHLEIKNKSLNYAFHDRSFKLTSLKYTM